MDQSDWEKLESWDSQANKALYKKSYELARMFLPKEPNESTEIVAEEAVECMIIKILQGKINYAYKPYALLKGIVRNKCMEYLRKKNMDADLTSQFPSSEDPEEAEYTEIARTFLEKSSQVCFQKMGAKCQQLLILSIYEEKSHREIAEIMGYSEKFVRVKRNRCLEFLKKCFSKHSPD